VTVGSSKSGVADVTSPATVQVVNVNDNPSGAPTIDGTKVVSNLLTANTSAIADEDGLGSFSYQWKRDGAAISGATASTYTLVDADANTNISVTVSYTDQPLNNTGSAESLTSQGYAVSAATISISGTSTEDQQLSVDLGDLQGANSYQWKRDGSAISGATSSTYTLLQIDVGYTISVTVGSSVTGVADKNAPATGNVLNVNDNPSGAPTIDGTKVVSNLLTANTSAIADEDGLGSFSYQWKRDNVAILGATASTYTLVDIDANTSITVTVSYTDTPRNNTGNAESLTSQGYSVSAASVSVTGTVEEDQTLSVNLGDLQGANSYQWKRAGAAISGATSSTYTLVQADVGSQISVTVGSSVNGVADVTSGETIAVVNVNDNPTC
jgi:hypothetical protein